MRLLARRRLVSVVLPAERHRQNFETRNAHRLFYFRCKRQQPIRVAVSAQIRQHVENPIVAHAIPSQRQNSRSDRPIGPLTDITLRQVNKLIIDSIQLWRESTGGDTTNGYAALTTPKGRNSVDRAGRRRADIERRISLFGTAFASSREIKIAKVRAVVAID